MKLILENIGMLQHAEISLRKLCVIAGENDNGKSTIGKIVFCIVKAINRYREDLQESKEFWITEKTDEIYFRLREAIRSTDPEVMDALRRLRMPSRQRLNAEEQLAAVDESIEHIFALAEFEPQYKQKIITLRDKIQAMLDQPENINRSIENALNKVFASEFDASLLLHGATRGRIQLVENDLTLIDLVVTDDGVRLMGGVEPVALKDATFIESPLILNNHDVLARSQTLLDVSQRRSGYLSLSFTTLHTKDLFDKLRTPVLPLDLFSPDDTVRTSRVLADLEALIQGEVAYDKKERDFVFRRSSGAAISIKNTASGIKVFGLLKILVDNEFVTKDTILIFDEPENHLHPKWQLKLAEVLLSLVESGVYVLVSSHSPYLIEALKRGVDRAGLAANEARFALAQERNINDEDRLSDIFSVLAEPFEVFRKMDAEDLRDE
jgi:ABC-type cobalamin/Fe3+-siderophores transport system ATPase subunit